MYSETLWKSSKQASHDYTARPCLKDRQTDFKGREGVILCVVAPVCNLRTQEADAEESLQV